MDLNLNIKPITECEPCEAASLDLNLNPVENCGSSSNSGGSGNQVLRFTELQDTPNSYVGQAGALVEVGSSESGLVFRNLIVKTLISPIISAVWSLFKNDGTTPYNPSSSSGKNIVVDKGAKVNLSSTYRYPSPSSNQKLPTTITGDYGSTILGPDTDSAPLVVTNIITNTNYQVILHSPKEGLIVVNDQVLPATGESITQDSISVSFLSKGYLGYSLSSILTSSEILNLENSVFLNSLNRTVANVTASAGQFTYIVYEASYGSITNIILDGAAPVLGAFTRLADVIITNEAGFNITMAVYRSNATAAFTNNTLTIS